METKDNYLLQLAQAKQTFLTYDQQKLIAKLQLSCSDDYLYTRMLGDSYRIHRRTADISRLSGGEWVDANTFAEGMTLLDLVCDSREDRFLSGREKSMQSFGLMFHRNLLEDARDSEADFYQAHLAEFREACRLLGGVPVPNGDVAYAIEVFDGLCITLRFWEGDDEFPARLRYFWDENAAMYIKYETMHFFLGLLQQRIREKMNV